MPTPLSRGDGQRGENVGHRFAPDLSFLQLHQMIVKQVLEPTAGGGRLSRTSRQTGRQRDGRPQEQDVSLMPPAPVVPPLSGLESFACPVGIYDQIPHDISA